MMVFPDIFPRIDTDTWAMPYGFPNIDLGDEPQLPRGKGWFIWPMDNLEDNDVLKVINLAQEAQLGHVIIKVADGDDTYPFAWQHTIDVPALVVALHGLDIQVWGYQYIYLFNPEAEAEKAIERINGLHLDGLIVDAEKECKGQPLQASSYMSRLKALNPIIPIGLSSYRYPHLHLELPWRQFREQCDFDMPQVYWLQAHNPAAQLEASYQEFAQMIPHLPYIPTGSAWYTAAWTATAGDVIAFMDKAKELQLPAVNFWVWENCRKYIPNVWDAIAQYEFGGAPIPPEPEPEPEDEMTKDEIIKGVNEQLLILDNATDALIELRDALEVLDCGGTPEPPAPPPPPPPPVPPADVRVVRVVQGEKANGFWQIGKNKSLKPILGIKYNDKGNPERQWLNPATIQVRTPDADVDSSVKFYEVYGVTFTGNPFNNNKCYVKYGDVEFV